MSSFIESGDEPFALVRDASKSEPPRDPHPAPSGPSSVKSGRIRWNPYRDSPVSNPSVLEGFDAVVNLSGENLSEGRWTAERKAAFGESRIVPTRSLSALLARCSGKPKVLVCASATGWYGDRGNDILTEQSAPGAGFLASLCRAWEAASTEAEQAGIRVVHLRFGVILSRDGGALAKMLPIFRAGLGGRLGNGRQWVSWAAMADVVRAIRFAISEPSLAGPVNVCSPLPETNADFTRSLAAALRRPAVLPVPAFALRALFGEMADATVLSSARVLPQRLEQAGFRFEHPRLDDALADVLRAQNNPRVPGSA